MKENKVLFFQDLENFLSPESLEQSKSDFRNSFLPFGILTTVEEVEGDVILHLANGDTSSWKHNFTLETEQKFNEVKSKMEESFLKNDLVHFTSYVQRSLKRLQRIDHHNYSRTYVTDLLLYFFDKYNLNFNISDSNSSPANVYHLRNGIRKIDIEKLFVLSVDEYIDDSNFELEDFNDFMDGKLGTVLKFKCTTGEMAEYVKQLLSLFEESEHKNVGMLFFFHSKRGTIFTSNNFSKTLSTNPSTISLSKDLLNHFIDLKRKAK